jgi:hypothetical protein
MPNINSNLLPNHGTGNSGVGMIEVGKKKQSVEGIYEEVVRHVCIVRISEDEF